MPVVPDPSAPRGARLRPVSLHRTAAGLRAAGEAAELARVGGARVRVVAFSDTQEWDEAAQDVLFLCWEGGITVEVAGGAPVPLGRGEMVLVPAGRAHRVVAVSRAVVLVVEHAPRPRPPRGGPRP